MDKKLNVECTTKQMHEVLDRVGDVWDSQPEGHRWLCNPIPAIVEFVCFPCGGGQPHA